MKPRRVFVVVVASVVVMSIAGVSSAISAGAAGSVGAAPPATRVVTVRVASPFANPGDVQVQDIAGNVLATCQGASTPGNATCTVNIADGSSVVFVAQPLARGGFKNWTGACGPVSGPVCALKVKSNHTVVGHFGSSSPVAAAVPTLNAVEGDVSGCSGYLDAQTVNGTGFPINTPVTLSDDGHVVASGTTDPNGFAQLSYVTVTEPGIYRSLVMGAAGVTATTDVYNAGSVCSYWNGIGTGTVNFGVVGTDFDANSTVTIKFVGNPPVRVSADAAGSFTTTTPNYACAAGTTRDLIIKAVRGAGTPFSRTFENTFTVTC